MTLKGFIDLLANILEVYVNEISWITIPSNLLASSALIAEKSVYSPVSAVF